MNSDSKRHVLLGGDALFGRKVGTLSPVRRMIHAFSLSRKCSRSDEILCISRPLLYDLGSYTLLPDQIAPDLLQERSKLRSGRDPHRPIFAAAYVSASSSERHSKSDASLQTNVELRSFNLAHACQPKRFDLHNSEKSIVKSANMQEALD